MRTGSGASPAGRPNPAAPAPAGSTVRASGGVREKSPSVSIRTDSTGRTDPIRNATYRPVDKRPSSHDDLTERIPIDHHHTPASLPGPHSIIAAAHPVTMRIRTR
ncbi:hypothetical protein GCM10009828_016050 [Actinoplanes couchii]|uniref:Uncharacterized protein n=1 Tax=Actinoplanes couchii TaxID=403638 RepID=A0ABQ3X460_9ACTN|nr:hypothetical protein Aco03nite_017200 [Actinoplanes couchii]